MATNTKATAKQSRNTKTTTSKQAGVKPRKPRKATPKQAGAIVASLAKARKANLAKGNKGNYTDKGAETLAKACAKAMTLPSLSSAGITTSKSKHEAKRRRDHARTNRATLVLFSDVIHTNKAGEITHDRPENTIRARVQSIAKAMGLPADTFYVVRAEAYEAGETPKAYIVTK